MSVEYYLVCHKHKEKVWACSDGFSGPLLQCDRSLAAFVITHRNCNIAIIDEHNEECDNYTEWHNGDWNELLNYEYT